MIAAGKHADTATPRRVLANIEKDPSVDKQVGHALLSSLPSPPYTHTFPTPNR